MFKGCKQEDMPPHIYATAQSAYREMLATRHDQSIVFLGRSGSGKSWNAKHTLQYLAQVAGTVNGVVSGNSRIVNQICDYYPFCFLY